MRDDEVHAIAAGTLMLAFPHTHDEAGRAVCAKPSLFTRWRERWRGWRHVRLTMKAARRVEKMRSRSFVPFYDFLEREHRLEAMTQAAYRNQETAMEASRRLGQRENELRDATAKIIDLNLRLAKQKAVIDDAAEKVVMLTAENERLAKFANRARR